MGSVANPALEAAAERAPVVVTGSKCSFDPFAKAQATTCGRTLGELTKLGVPYKVVASGRTFDSVTIHIGGHEVASEDPALLQPAQIGRESWRERVCQYVSISVVAVYLKKKKAKKN